MQVKVSKDEVVMKNAHWIAMLRCNVPIRHNGRKAVRKLLHSIASKSFRGHVCLVSRWEVARQPIAVMHRQATLMLCICSMHENGDE